MPDIDALLREEFGSTGIGGTERRRYTNLKTQQDLQKAFEIMDDVQSIKDGLDQAAEKKQLDTQAKKKYRSLYAGGGKDDPAVVAYVTDKVEEARNNAHAKANAIHSYLVHYHTGKPIEEVHGGSGDGSE